MLTTRKWAILAMAICAIPFNAALARVGGPCVNCHTMHNSQNGLSVTEDGKGPFPALTVDDCVGCHSSSGSETIIDMGSGTRIPIVFNTAGAPTYPPDGSSSSALAGGNFYWVAQGDDSKGHNVYGISAKDKTLSKAPGASTSCSPCHDSLALPGSGCEGCHLARHHADDTAPLVEGANGSYRFLGDLMSRAFGFPDTTRGVKGIEDSDWEQTPTATRHNTYAGVSGEYPKQFGVFLSTSSIGQFCCGCHGNFHHKMNSAQPSGMEGAWIRHPADVKLPSNGEYGNYTVYNPLAPVAKTNPTAGMKNSPTVEPGSDLVTCISCHRPHGSPYPDMLRWDYDSCSAGVANEQCGCFVCHNLKDE